jgi:hypothetical protein
MLCTRQNGHCLERTLQSSTNAMLHANFLTQHLVALEVCSMAFMQSVPAATPDEVCALVNFWVLSTFREPILALDTCFVLAFSRSLEADL